MKGPEMKLSTLSLDHLGLVAAIFDALGISEVIDESDISRSIMFSPTQF